MSAFSGTDETRNCRVCKKDFVFSISEQQWFTDRGLTIAPNRCKECRRNNSNTNRSGGYNSTGGYNASGNQHTPERKQPSPMPQVEQKTYPRDYREEDDSQNTNGRGKKGHRKSRRDNNDDDFDW